MQQQQQQQPGKSVDQSTPHAELQCQNITPEHNRWQPKVITHV
jgi:hypothetical protein